MSEVAIRRMTVDEFLRWDDGTDTRHELIGGFPMAMAPPLEAHRVLATRLAVRLEAALAGRRPCNAQVETGILHPDRADTFFVADLGVTCAPFDAQRQYMADPILLVAILPPSTERHDRRIKVPAYQRIASIQEILLVDSEAPYAALHRRQGAQWIIQISVGGEGTIGLSSVGIDIALSELYDGLASPDDPQI
jgi:Uma2 family endonuclease